MWCTLSATRSQADPPPDDLFSSGQSIQRYIEATVARYHLNSNLQLETEVLSAAWDIARCQWIVHTYSKYHGAQTLACKILISAVGNLTLPVRRPLVAFPDLS